MYNLVGEFLLATQAEGRSPATLRQYKWHLTQFVDWLEENSTGLEGLTKSTLRAWSASIRDRWEPATCRVAVISTRAFLRFCYAEELLSTDFAPVLKVPKTPPRVQRTVQPEEILSMIERCKTINMAGLTEVQARATSARNAALVVIMFDALLRASEVCNLDISDVDLSRQIVTVLGKGDRQDLVSISPVTVNYIGEWLNWRPTVARDSKALFVSVTGNTPGQRLTSNGLRIIVQRVARRAGVEPLSPHAFRRGGAVQALRNGAPSRILKDHGRWANDAMIATYTRYLKAEDEMHKYSPMLDLLDG